MIRREKEERLWGEEVGFCSYMPPFFFDFFFLAFVGLFTRLHIHNGICLRILRFFWKSILINRFFWSRPIFNVSSSRSLAEFSSLRYSRVVEHLSYLRYEPGMIFLTVQFSWSWESSAAKLLETSPSTSGYSVRNRSTYSSV
jgi:hypothetical protein